MLAITGGSWNLAFRAMNEDLPHNTSDGAILDRHDLLALVYAELRSLAAARMAAQSSGHTLQPTALVHEAWLRVSKLEDARWNSREHFFRAAAMAMRQILVDHARAKARRKPPQDFNDAAIEGRPIDFEDPQSDVLIIHECLGMLEKSYPDCARVVQLKFFAGLSNQETAEVLGFSLRSTERLWAFARAKLFTMVTSGRRAETP